MPTYATQLLENNLPPGFAIIYDPPTAPVVVGTSITGATNATPIVITTSTNHNFPTSVAGNTVLISGVQGNWTANGLWIITALTATTFSLNGSAGGGAYTSGGTVTIPATYSARLVPIGS